MIAPALHPILFRIGSYEVPAYGVALTLAFAVGIAIARRRARAVGIDEERVIDACLIALVAALVGARLLAWPRERLHDLAVNATILLRYGLEHERELGAATASGTGAVRRTLLRHLTLFEHALEPAAAQQLHAAIEQIEAEAPLAA